MNRLRTLFLVAVVFVVLAVGQSDQASASDRKAVAEIWNQIAVLVQKKDRAGLEKVYAENFVHLHAKGKIDDRKARLDSLLAGGPNIDVGGEVAFGFRKFGETIIAAGTIKTTSDDGKPITYAVTKIYAKQNGRFVYVGSHASPVVAE